MISTWSCLLLVPVRGLRAAEGLRHCGDGDQRSAPVRRPGQTSLRSHGDGGSHRPCGRLQAETSGWIQQRSAAQVCRCSSRVQPRCVRVSAISQHEFAFTPFHLRCFLLESKNGKWQLSLRPSRLEDLNLNPSQQNFNLKANPAHN